MAASQSRHQIVGAALVKAMDTHGGSKAARLVHRALLGRHVGILTHVSIGIDAAAFWRRVTRLRQTGMALLMQAAIVRVAALVSWRSQSRIDGARGARPVVRKDRRPIANIPITQAGRDEVAGGEVGTAGLEEGVSGG